MMSDEVNRIEAHLYASNEKQIRMDEDFINVNYNYKIVQTMARERELPANLKKQDLARLIALHNAGAHAQLQLTLREIKETRIKTQRQNLYPPAQGSSTTTAEADSASVSPRPGVGHQGFVSPNPDPYEYNINEIEDDGDDDYEPYVKGSKKSRGAGPTKQARRSGLDVVSGASREEAAAAPAPGPAPALGPAPDLLSGPPDAETPWHARGLAPGAHSSMTPSQVAGSHPIKTSSQTPGALGARPGSTTMAPSAAGREDGPKPKKVASRRSSGGSVGGVSKGRVSKVGRVIKYRRDNNFVYSKATSPMPSNCIAHPAALGSTPGLHAPESLGKSGPSKSWSGYPNGAHRTSYQPSSHLQNQPSTMKTSPYLYSQSGFAVQPYLPNTPVPNVNNYGIGSGSLPHGAPMVPPSSPNFGVNNIYQNPPLNHLGTSQVVRPTPVHAAIANNGSVSSTVPGNLEWLMNVRSEYLHMPEQLSPYWKPANTNSVNSYLTPISFVSCSPGLFQDATHTVVQPYRPPFAPYKETNSFQTTSKPYAEYQPNITSDLPQAHNQVSRSAGPNPSTQAAPYVYQRYKAWTPQSQAQYSMTQPLPHLQQPHALQPPSQQILQLPHQSKNQGLLYPSQHMPQNPSQDRYQQPYQAYQEDQHQQSQQPQQSSLEIPQHNHQSYFVHQSQPLRKQAHQPQQLYFQQQTWNRDRLEQYCEQERMVGQTKKEFSLQQQHANHQQPSGCSEEPEGIGNSGLLQPSLSVKQKTVKRNQNPLFSAQFDQQHKQAVTANPPSHPSSQKHQVSFDHTEGPATKKPCYEKTVDKDHVHFVSGVKTPPLDSCAFPKPQQQQLDPQRLPFPEFRGQNNQLSQQLIYDYLTSAEQQLSSQGNGQEGETVASVEDGTNLYEPVGSEVGESDYGSSAGMNSSFIEDVLPTLSKHVADSKLEDFAEPCQDSVSKVQETNSCCSPEPVNSELVCSTSTEVVQSTADVPVTSPVLAEVSSQTIVSSGNSVEEAALLHDTDEFQSSEMSSTTTTVIESKSEVSCISPIEVSHPVVNEGGSSYLELLPVPYQEHLNIESDQEDYVSLNAVEAVSETSLVPFKSTDVLTIPLTKEIDTTLHEVVKKDERTNEAIFLCSDGTGDLEYMTLSVSQEDPLNSTSESLPATLPVTPCTSDVANVDDVTEASEEANVCHQQLNSSHPSQVSTIPVTNSDVSTETVSSMDEYLSSSVKVLSSNEVVREISESSGSSPHALPDSDFSSGRFAVNTESLDHPDFPTLGSSQSDNGLPLLVRESTALLVTQEEAQPLDNSFTCHQQTNCSKEDGVVPSCIVCLPAAVRSSVLESEVPLMPRNAPLISDNNINSREVPLKEEGMNSSLSNISTKAIAVDNADDISSDQCVKNSSLDVSNGDEKDLDSSVEKTCAPEDGMKPAEDGFDDMKEELFSQSANVLSNSHPTEVADDPEDLSTGKSETVENTYQDEMVIDSGDVEVEPREETCDVWLNMHAGTDSLDESQDPAVATKASSQDADGADVNMNVWKQFSGCSVVLEQTPGIPEKAPAECTETKPDKTTVKAAGISLLRRKSSGKTLAGKMSRQPVRCSPRTSSRVSPGYFSMISNCPSPRPDSPCQSESAMQQPAKGCKSCPNSSHGCVQILPPAQLTTHHLVCEFALVECPAMGCSWSNVAKKLCAHIREVHRGAIGTGIESKHTVSIEDIQQQQRLTFLREASRKLFVICIHSFGDSIYASIQYIAAGRAEKPISATGVLEFMDKDKNPHAWRGKIGPIQLQLDAVRESGNCLQVPLHLLADTSFNFYTTIRMNQPLAPSSSDPLH